MKKNKDNALKCLKKHGLVSVAIMKSINPNAVQIPAVSIRCLSSEKPITPFIIDDEFNDNFGPFDEVEEINLSGVVSEDSIGMEQDEELSNIKSIKGVIMAKRISKNVIQFGVA